LSLSLSLSPVPTWRLGFDATSAPGRPLGEEQLPFAVLDAPPRPDRIGLRTLRHQATRAAGQYHGEIRARALALQPDLERPARRADARIAQQLRPQQIVQRSTIEPTLPDEIRSEDR